MGGFLLVLFCIFINNLDIVTDCIFGELGDDTKMSGAVHTIEGKDAMQRNLDILEKCCTWAGIIPGM